MISFVSTGWLTLFVVLCNYLFVFDSTVPPFHWQGALPLLPRGQTKADGLAWTSNPLDSLIGKIFSKAIRPLTDLMTHVSPPSLVNWFKRLAKREQTKDAFTQVSTWAPRSLVFSEGEISSRINYRGSQWPVISVSWVCATFNSSPESRCFSAGSYRWVAIQPTYP